MLGLTEGLVALAGRSADAIPSRAALFARLSLFDWMTCGIAGRDEPLAVKLRQLAKMEGGTGHSSIIAGSLAPARMAALANGATSHALDYDDTHFAHVGHLSVGIYPAALAIAEQEDLSAADMMTAFLLGAEGAIRVGMTLGRAHYNLGFHQTATAGAFGATLAAGRLLGLDAVQMRHALGLCGTRASGMTSQFGSMGKPYNAGIAAANGVECATLAQLGFTSADDGLLGHQGFVGAHMPAAAIADAEVGVAMPDAWFDDYLFPDNKYKLHACCHGLHPMIEALLAAQQAAGFAFGDIELFSLETNPRWLAVCDIKAPRTGLEVKFSYNWLAGMTLRGDNTGDDRLYQNTLADDDELRSFASHITITGNDALTDLQARGSLTLRDGSRLPVWFDLAEPLAEEVIIAKLRAKSDTIIGGTSAAIWGLYPQVQDLGARSIGHALSVAAGGAETVGLRATS
jgi:2-methylcitrate dehydratase PrpD